MKRKPIWAAGVNLSGLWGPVKMTYYPDIKEYYDKSENLSVKGRGHETKYGTIFTFASISEREVNLWAKGVKDAMSILKEWCGK